MSPPTNMPSSLEGKTTAPQPRDEDIDVFGMTHTGKVRPENQDHFLLCSMHRSIRVRMTSLPNPELLEMPGQRFAFLGAVADGVGGSEGGAEASRAAIEAIAIYATHAIESYATSPNAHEALLQALRDAALASSREVVELSRKRPNLAGMATTLTMAFSVWPSLFLLQVGDSRAYRLSGKKFERLTKDQTIAQELVDDGVLPAARASTSPFAHVLSSAIGSRARPEVTRYESVVGEVVLLCTDGLTKHVPDDRIRDRLLSMTSSEQVCRALVEDALAAGGTDNITVVAGRAKPKPE